MVYVPETYEERADFAEYRLDRLEDIVVAALKKAESDKDLALEDLRSEWKNYLQNSSYSE